MHGFFSSDKKYLTIINNQIIASKKEIIISEEKGIYLNGDDKKKYNILRTSKRFMMIKYLFENEMVTSKDLLIFVKDNDLSNLKHTINTINRLCLEKIELKNNIIVSLDTGGYKLNRDDYNIKFI